MASTTCTNTVSTMTPQDLREVVAVHLRSFPGFFLSQLGPRFLLSLYQELLRDPTGIALVCKQDPRVLGFVAGTAEPRGFYKRLLVRRWLRFALASVVPVLRNPIIVPRLLNAFRKAKEEPDDEGRALLMSIAVDLEAQAGGIGAALVEGFLAECQRRGLSSVHLTTDKCENDRVNRFYSRLGFTISRVITTPQGRVMNDYRIEIADGAQKH
jgi:ribosomal protein S18 acetylase RimI-like enzyme